MTINLEKRIMNRVYFIFYCKKFLSVFAIKAYFSLLLLGVLISEVSLMNVFKNTMNVGAFNLEGVSSFYSYAFMHTEFLVQTTSILAIIFSGYLVWGNAKNLLVERREGI